MVNLIITREIMVRARHMNVGNKSLESVDLLHWYLDWFWVMQHSETLI
jgi:hypothetical protein